MQRTSSPSGFPVCLVVILLLSFPLDLFAQPLTFSSGMQALADQIASEMTGGKRQKIAVIEFVDIDGNVTNFGKFLSEELITRLFISRKFQVVERNLLSKVINEHKLNVSGYVDESTARAFGRILGVDAICSGTLVEVVDTVRINARLISTETGAIFAVAAVELFKDENLKKLLGQRALKTPVASSQPAATPVQQVQKSRRSEDYMDLSLWEILDGHWELRNGAFYGSGGHLILREELTDYEIEVTVCHVSGPIWAAAGVGTRMNVVKGGSARFRGRTSDIQGYVFNFNFDGTYNVFNGISGNWYLLHPEWKEWQRSPALDRQEDRIRIKASGDRVTIYVNSRFINEFHDSTHHSGAVTLWSQEPSHIIRFSDIRIEKK